MVSGVAGDAAFARAGLFRNGNLHRYCGLVLDCANPSYLSQPTCRAKAVRA